MSDIFREVDEALQREKAAKFWQEYGPTLIGAALVMILATAGTTGYLRWSEHKNQARTAQLLASLDQPDMAASLMAVAKETDSGHAMVALMNAASSKAADKDFAGAAALYDQAASTGGADADLRDLAVILSVQSALQAEPKADKAALIEKLKPVADKKSAFALQARLDLALLYGDGLKEYTAALEMLNGFDAPGIPASLQEKANALKHVYTFEASRSAE